MKGVSAVIAIILILMIVVALAALAYTWFTGIFSQLTATTETAVTETTGQMGTGFRIEFANYVGSDNTNVTIRNTGSQAFNASRSTVYIGNYLRIYDGVQTPSAGGILAPGDVAVIYNVDNDTPSIACCNLDLKVSIETGLSDTTKIVC